MVAARDIIGPSGTLEEQWVIAPDYNVAEWLIIVRTVGGGNPDPAVPRVHLPGEYSVDARTVRVDALMPDWFPGFVGRVTTPPYTEDDPQKKWDYLMNQRLRDPTTTRGIYARAESRPRAKKGHPKPHDAFMAELFREAFRDITLKAPDGSAVWWTDLDRGPVRIATLWDLVTLHRRGQPQIDRGRALWLLSGDQWDKAEYPAPSKGGPPYIEGVSVAREPGKMPAMGERAQDYPDFEAALQAASSRFGATHVVRQGNRSAVIYSPTSKGYERRSLSCDRGFFHWPKQADVVDEVPENAERVVDVLDLGFDPDAPPRREAMPVRRAAENGRSAGRRSTGPFPPGEGPWFETYVGWMIADPFGGKPIGPFDEPEDAQAEYDDVLAKGRGANEARGSDRERWEKLQGEFRRLTDEMTKVEVEAHVKWGPHGLRYASRALQTKHQRLKASRDRVYEKIFAMTQKLSPRDWGTGVPTWWVAGKLTFDDLVRPIGEPLSVTPPLAYGATRPMQEGAREMGAVREVREHRGEHWPEAMRELLNREFPDGDEFSREAAIYWYASDHHTGQWSPLYAVLSQSEFRPGPSHRSIEDEDEEAVMMYDALVQKWGGPGASEAREEASIPTKAQLKIIQAFRDRRLMGNPMRDSISTDGDTIYSYQMPIAGRNPRGGIWIADPKGAPSATTRTHIYGLQRTFTPAEIAGTQAAEARRGERVTTPHGDRFEVVEYTLPVYWASYLINGDASGLENGEQKQIDEWLEREGNPHFVDVSEDTHFAHRNDATNLGGDVATYTAHMRPGGRGTAPDSGGGVPRMQSGYAFYTPSKRKGDWKKIPNDDWEHVVVGEDEIGKSSFVGIRDIDGSMHDIFEVNFAHGRGGRGYYAQLQTHTRGRGAAHEFPGGPATAWASEFASGPQTAMDFASPKEAITHAQSAWGATHVDFHGTRNRPTVYGTKDGARWKKTLFKEKGKFHWPDKFAKGPKRLHGAIELTPVAMPTPRAAPVSVTPLRGKIVPPTAAPPDRREGYVSEAREEDRRYTTKQSQQEALRDDVFFEGEWIGQVQGPYKRSFRAGGRADFYEWKMPGASHQGAPPFGHAARFGEARTRRAAISALIRAHKQRGGHGAREARENPATDLQDAIPWVRVTRDPERYKEALARAQKIGPVDDAKKVYELVGPALMKEDQETFIVVLIDVRQNCRGVAEIHRGARSRVATSVLDVMRIVVAAGAEGFIVCHNHPSGKAMPSDADRSLTKAIERAAKPFAGETAFLDHVVIGAGEYFSFADNKLHRAKS
jgi:hypothetical protein